MSIKYQRFNLRQIQLHTLKWRIDLMLNKLKIYFHTIRHLKLVQIYGRLWYVLARPKLSLAIVPSSRQMNGRWIKPACREPSMIGPTNFEFLSERGDLEVVGWDGAERGKLWRYNQHYFDDLNASDSEHRVAWHRALLEKWIDGNPVKRVAAWEPYPTSLRVVNWVKWVLSGNQMSDACVQSLAIQARWLRQRLEIHLLGNHLFANAKALVFAGLYFEGPEAEDWLSTGFRILAREIPEQILADGGHFERSTMYHALAYEDMLDLLNVTASFPEASRRWSALIADWPRVASKMGRWLHAMCHPDGEIALFNDAAFGIAPAPQELFAYSARLGCVPPEVLADIVHLDASGYIRVGVGGAVLLIDAAPVGPDYLPGHAHADTLSFELSLNGQRVVVNGGTSHYGLGPLRDRERGTAAHSTVEINRQDSSEVWAGFRVARRAYPFDVSVRRERERVVVDAAHDGYRRLPGQPVHRRRWILLDGRLEVIDQIEGQFDAAVARVHFHPDVRVDAAGLGGTVSWASKSVRWEAQAVEANVTTAKWHPRFGVAIEAACLELKINPAVTAEPVCQFALDWR